MKTNLSVWFERIKARLYPYRYRLGFGLGFLVFVYFLGIGINLWRLPFWRISAFEAVPANAALILRYNQPDSLAEQLGRSDYASAWAGLPLWREAQSEGQALLQLFEGDSSRQFALKRASWTLAAQAASIEHIDWLYLIEGSGYSLDPWLGSLPADWKIGQSRHRGSYTVHHIRHPKAGDWYLAWHRGLWMASRWESFVEMSQVQIDEIGTAIPRQWRFRKILGDNQSRREGLEIYLNIRHLDLLLSVLSPETQQTHFQALKTLGDWLGGELQFERENWVMTGRYYPPTQRGHFWAELAKEKNGRDSVGLAHFLPDNLSMLTAFFIADARSFYQNTKGEYSHADFETYILPWLGSESAYFITDPTEPSFRADKFVLLKAKDIDKAKASLEDYEAKVGALEHRRLQNFEVVRLAAKDWFLPWFGAELNPLQQPYYLIVEDYVLFANSISVLQLWVEKYNFGRTMAKQTSFAPFLHQLRNRPQAYFWAHTPSALNFLKAYAQEDRHEAIEQAFTQFRALGPIGLSLAGADDHFNLTCSGMYSPEVRAQSAVVKPKVAWRFELTHEAAGSAQALKTQDGQHLVFVQDTAHVLYVLNSGGELLWKYPLEGRLQSEIQTLDFYGSGGQQYAFNTLKQIYIIDPDQGQVLKNIRLAASASSGLKVMDFGRGPRLYLSCANGQSFGFDQNGQPLPGWNPLPSGASPFPIYYSSETLQKGKTKELKEQFWMLNKNGKLQSFARDGHKVFAGLQIEEAQSFWWDEQVKRLVIGQSNGRITLVNTQGKHFGLALPSEWGEGKTEFILADIWGDSRPEYIRRQGSRLMVQGYDSLDQFVEVWRYDLGHQPAKIFPIQLPGKDKAWLGTVLPSQQSIYLFEPLRGLVPGLPLGGNYPFIGLDLFGDKRPVLLSVMGNQLYAYKL